MEQKPVVFVTGANTGLGYEIVKALYQSRIAYEIILGGRSLSKVEEAQKTVTSGVPSSSSTLSTVQVDLSDDGSIEAASEAIKERHGRLDILVNNAGGAFDSQIASGSMALREAWNVSWDTNVTGTYVLTHALAPLLIQSSNPRLLFVTSGTSTLTGTEDISSRLSTAPAAGWPKTATYLPLSSYRSSKTGMNMMAREWERELRNDGVKVFIISPGLLATGLGGYGQQRLREQGAAEPEVGGFLVRDVVEGKRDADVGKVVLRTGMQAW